MNRAGTVKWKECTPNTLHSTVLLLPQVWLSFWSTESSIECSHTSCRLLVVSSGQPLSGVIMGSQSKGGVGRWKGGGGTQEGDSCWISKLC